MTTSNTSIGRGKKGSKFWMQTLVNRLSFLVELRKQGIDAKLILLNLVDDPTHIKTGLDDWLRHYEEIYQTMLGTTRCPDHVLLINMDVG
ncbi:hypothetical protein J0B03_03830 [Alkalibacter rhizosphaerae]|uniref:Uncharacterized protein n=1 Tax=Alkalibacter rhizosphaerae TaxID=2815577 RepID=A0A975AJ01_9FIRM|nr:hypothetical protein [Alkalibacter rhizosphaerae]QSX09204.1 hypothetical protein J0B03_03830 [Alkalibacter rhizosphaerae]